jgi:hypothetical protein
MYLIHVLPTVVNSEKDVNHHVGREWFSECLAGGKTAVVRKERDTP